MTRLFIDDLGLIYFGEKALADTHLTFDKSSLTWVPGENVSVSRGIYMTDDDLLYDISVLPKKPNPIVPEWITPDIAWILGRYIQFGQARYRAFYIGNPYVWHIVVPSKMVTATIEACKAIGILRDKLKVCKANSNPDDDLVKIYTFDSTFVRCFIELFHRSNDSGNDLAKHIPKLLLSTSEEVARAFLSGWFADSLNDDSNCGASTRVSLSTVSQELTLEALYFVTRIAGMKNVTIDTTSSFSFDMM